MIPKFHFVYELLPFVKYCLFGGEITLISALEVMSNAPVYSHGLPNGQIWYHAKDYYPHFTNLNFMGSLNGAYWSN